jgi:hypothetical protein
MLPQLDKKTAECDSEWMIPFMLCSSSCVAGLILCWIWFWVNNHSYCIAQIVWQVWFFAEYDYEWITIHIAWLKLCGRYDSLPKMILSEWYHSCCVAQVVWQVWCLCQIWFWLNDTIHVVKLKWWQLWCLCQRCNLCWELWICFEVHLKVLTFSLTVGGGWSKSLKMSSSCQVSK